MPQNGQGWERKSKADVPQEALGGSRGTPGVTTSQHAMLIREAPNDPVSPDFRPGLFVKRASVPDNYQTVVYASPVSGPSPQ